MNRMHQDKVMAIVLSIDDERLPEMIQQQIDLHQKKLEHLEDRKIAVFPDKKIKENYGHYLIPLIINTFYKI
jgi:hypothetical protein